MPEARPYKFTSGEWGQHRAYKFEPGTVVEGDGSVRSYCDVYLSSGDKVIANVEMRTGDCGWPHVSNMIEMKANLALMSAAPNMLEVLERIRGMDRNEYRLTPTIYDLLEAAIKKATTF